MSEETRPLLSQSSTHVISNARRRTQLACGAILITETLERIAFYGIVGNLVLFLNKSPYLWMSYNATNALFIFTGLSYVTSLFGGWIADSCLGKFRTLFLFFVIYLAGYAFLPALYPYPTEGNDVADPPAWCASPSGGGNGSAGMVSDIPAWLNMTSAKRSAKYETCSWAVFLALGIMAFGNGAVKANIAPFGADQIKHEGPNTTRMFFTWFYWCINLGALLSLGVLSYVQQQVSFFWGYVAPCSCLGLALLVFLAGRPLYISKPAQGSVLTNIFRILREACCTQSHGSPGCCSGGCWSRRPTRSNRENGVEQYGDGEPGWLDRAKVRYGGSFHDNMVDDVKSIGKILVVFLAMVPYWLVYFQMQTTFVVQGLHMRLDFGNVNANTTDDNEFKIPPAWLSLFDVVFLVLLLPLFDRAIYPALDRRGVTLPLRTRILVGMVFSTAAVLAAGGLEARRLEVFWRDGAAHKHVQIIGNTTYYAADLSILWQIPQYALIGVGEVFASVAGLELAYIEAPRSMQSLIMGLFWLCQGLGSMLGSAVVLWFRGVWFFSQDGGDINCRVKSLKEQSCHLDYFYYFLAGLQVFGMILFMLITWYLKVGYTATSRRHNKSGYVTVTTRVGRDSRENSVSPTSSRHIQRHSSDSSTASSG